MQEQLTYIVCRDCKKVFIFDEDADDHNNQTGHEQFDKVDFDSVFANEGASAVRVVLQRAIIASLRSLGKRTMYSVIRHLNNNNILIDSNNLNIRKFYESLKEIIGPSADTVIESTIQQLVLHCKVETGRDLTNEMDSLLSRSSDEKLMYVMKVLLRLHEWRGQ